MHWISLISNKFNWTELFPSHKITRRLLNCTFISEFAKTTCLYCAIHEVSYTETHLPRPCFVPANSSAVALVICCFCCVWDGNLAVCQGYADVKQSLLALPFNYLRHLLHLYLIDRARRQIDVFQAQMQVISMDYSPPLCYRSISTSPILRQPPPSITLQWWLSSLYYLSFPPCHKDSPSPYYLSIFLLDLPS